MATAWITPRSVPTDTVLVELTVPNQPEYIAAIRGVILLMTDPANWEKAVDGIEPIEAAEWAVEILQSLET